MLVVYSFFFFCQDQGDRLKGELYSQPLVRFYLDG